jgi:hypothetical protein
MKSSSILWVAILSVAITLASAPVLAQSSATGVTGAVEGIFPGGAAFNGIPLRGLESGAGVFFTSDGAATGVFHTRLLGTSPFGQPQDITVEGEVSGGFVAADGSATLSGIAIVDMGDGTLPLLGVPFTVTVSARGLLLTLGTSPLPSATVVAGSMTIE